MFHKFILILFCFLGISAVSEAQDIFIKGYVWDETSNEPVMSVAVYNQEFVSDITAEDGSFTMFLPSGKHTLTFSRIGFDTYQMDLLVTEDRKDLTGLIILLKSKVVGIDEVVISAGRYEQKLSELTVSMDVIKPGIIEGKNTTSVENILQNAPGLAIVDGEPQLRGGSGYSFGAGSRVLIMVDDLSMLSGDGGRPTWGILPVENIHQIEIIKGASSVLYGSSALSGVINIRTAFPEAKPKSKITAFQGFYSDPTNSNAKYWDGTPMQSGISLFHSRKIKNLGIVFGANIFGDDGPLGPMFEEGGDSITEAYNPFDVNRYKGEFRFRANLNLSYTFKSIPGLKAGLNTNWLKGESMNAFIWENTNTGMYSAAQGTATRTKQIVGNVDPYISYLSPKGTRHKINTRWQKLDNDNDNDQGNFSDVYYGEYQFHKKLDSGFAKNLVITSGLVGQSTNSSSDLYNGGAELGENKSSNYAYYLQLDRKFWERLNVSGGVRYEYYDLNGITETKPIFRSGVNFQLAEESYLRGSIGQGYRFPTIAEKYIQTAVGLLNIYSNEELESETSTSYELGFKQGYKFGKFQGFFDFAIFRQDYSNFVEFTFGQWGEPTIENLLGFGFKSLNTGEARIDGLEAILLGNVKLKKASLQYEFSYTFTNPVTLTPNLNYATSSDSVTYVSSSSDTTDYILKYRIQHLYRSDFQLSIDKFDIGFSTRINSQMKNIDNVYEVLEDQGVLPSGIGAWRETHTTPDAIFDARLSYHVNENHKFSLIVNNLANLEYSMRPLAIEPGRTVVIQYIYHR